MVILLLPTGYYILGAALAVALTALITALAPRLPDSPSLRLLRWRARRPATWPSTLSCLLMFSLIAAGAFGSHDPLGNPLPLVIWTVLWVGVTGACALLGNIWAAINPWTGPILLARRALGRTGAIGIGRLGYLPALIGFFGFAWFELVSVAPADPPTLARAVLIHWLVIFTLGVLEGPAWLRRGEFLTVFFHFVGLIAPLRIDRRGVSLVLPGARLLATSPPPPVAVFFLTLVLATLTFDGLRETFWWLGLTGTNPLEFPGRSAVMGINTLGLLGTWALTTAAILGCVALGRGHARQSSPFWPEAGAHLLAFLPIATGYHLVHYLVTLLGSGQYLIALLNDPLDRGWSLLGLPDHWISFGFLTDRSAVLALWNLQFTILLGAHLLAVIVGARIARRQTPPRPARLQGPMTVLMVAYTVLGLWLLSTPTSG